MDVPLEKEEVQLYRYITDDGELLMPVNAVLPTNTTSTAVNLSKHRLVYPYFHNLT